MSSLPEGERAVAESQSQRGMTQDEVKILCWGATPRKAGIFLRGRVELFTGGWMLLSPKKAWRRMKWKFFAEEQHPEKRNLPERKRWALYRRVSELLLSPKEGSESKRGMTQRMRRMTTRQMKEIEKESINIFFDAT